MDLIKTAHGMKVGHVALGLALIVISLIFGPISTIIAGLLTGDAQCRKAGIIVGILQFLLIALFGLGYFWGIINAIIITWNSK
jgi:hypothetical protein